jgi:hypothetical protein
MTERYKIGDRVGWNSEAGRVSGTIIRIHTHDFNYKGHTHHASSDSPQYEIKSAKPIILPRTRARHLPSGATDQSNSTGDKGSEQPMSESPVKAMTPESLEGALSGADDRVLLSKLVAAPCWRGAQD